MTTKITANVSHTKRTLKYARIIQK